MMRSHDALEAGFILHARNYRDSSLILDVLGQESGRYAVVARGAKSAKSKTRGRLQPFVPILLSTVGRGEMKTATTIEFPGSPLRLAGNNLLLGLYINELLYRLLGRYEPVPGLFNHYGLLLSQLQSDDDPLLAVRQFELLLLQELGYGISFEYDARTAEPVQADLFYRYVVHEGFHHTAAQDDASFTGQELMLIATGDLAPVNERRLKNLTRRSLAELLGGKPLKSRSLFRENQPLRSSS